MTISRSLEAVPETAEERSPRAASASEARISGELAALLGWLAVALFNVAGIARMKLRAGGSGNRLLHVFYDFGQTMTLGLLSFGAVWAWNKWAPKRPLATYFAVALLAIAVFQFVLPEDVEGFVDRWTDSGGGELATHALAAALSLAIVASFALGRLLGRGRLRFVPLALSLAIVVSNDYVLVNGYPGAHFWIACSGATLLSASLAGATVGHRTAGYFGRRAKLGALVALSLVALASVLVPPPGRVVVELLQRDTAFIAPALTRLTAEDGVEQVEIPSELAPWFTSRARRPDVAPSATRLVPEKPIVILVTIDALRIEVMSEKNARVAPTLHEMREQGVYFSQARSYGSDTRYSLAALFSGRYFSMLKWTSGHVRPTLEQDKLPRLSELLGARDVDTVFGNTLSRMFSPEFRIIGSFGEQFVTADGENPKGTPAVIDAAIERLRRQDGGPLFYYAHLLDPHGPYVRHGKRSASPRSAYLSEVNYADEHLGRLRAAIRELGLAHRTLLVVSSDHGEAFGEHGLYRHNKPLYEVMVHVPLLVEYPGAKPRTLDQHVSMMDLGPTVLDVFGVPTPGYWMGESLVPLLAGEAARSKRPIFMGRPKEEALLFADGIKVILRRGSSRAEEIYDLNRDPDEEDNLRDSLGNEGDRLVALATKYSEAHRWPNGDRPDTSR